MVIHHTDGPLRTHRDLKWGESFVDMSYPYGKGVPPHEVKLGKDETKDTYKKVKPLQTSKAKKAKFAASADRGTRGQVEAITREYNINAQLDQAREYRRDKLDRTNKLLDQKDKERPDKDLKRERDIQEKDLKRMQSQNAERRAMESHDKSKKRKTTTTTTETKKAKH